MEKLTDNEDRVLLERAIAEGLTDVPVRTTPLPGMLDCRIAAAAPGEIRLTFRPGSEFVQGHGVICGGIVATILDYALAFAALSRLGPGESVMSVGMNVSFLAPAMPGPLYTESRLAAFGRRLVHSEAQLFDDTGKLLAKASSPMMIARPKPAT